MIQEEEEDQTAKGVQEEEGEVDPNSKSKLMSCLLLYNKNAEFARILYRPSLISPWDAIVRLCLLNTKCNSYI